MLREAALTEKIAVVMNSPDEEIFPFRRLDPIPSGKPAPFVFMYHGSMVERNGLELAVDSLARLRDEVPHVELRIYGRSTPYLEQVMRKAESLGLQESVRYIGVRKLEQLAAEIQECNVGVIPNQRNTFTDINTPTRIFEYLAQGKPVVAPDTHGILDYFGHDELFYFTAGDAESMADAMRIAAADASEAVASAERGQRVYQRHIWHQERETLIQSVCELLGRNAAPPAEPIGN